MQAAPPAVDWLKTEPYATIISAAEKLEARGFSVDDIIKGLLCVSTAMDARLHGPSGVASRMYAIADRYAQETARAAN